MEAFEMIERNVQLEARLIDDLLDLTRIEQGKLEVLRKPVDMHSVIKQAVEVAMPDIKGKHQKLTVSLKASKYELTGDAMRLEQIIWNLLKNSSKFTPEGGKIRIASDNRQGWLRIEISDAGIGIPKTSLEKIFTAFTQASSDVTRKFGGLGLGLAIARATALAHEGTLHATSKGLDKGATFILELPLGVPDQKS
jgi:two-component system CheB/CheR fusion protein